MDTVAKQKIVLASSSRYRRELLERLGLPFSCLAPEIDETAGEGESGLALARRLSADKAHAVAQREPRAIIIASDQTAVCGESILGKPMTRENAIHQLTKQSGRSVLFHTALAVLNGSTRTLQLDVVSCSVTFRKLTGAQISNYVDVERPFDCAGSFRSEGMGIALLDDMDCPDPTALVGLPLIRLTALLARESIDVLLSSPVCGQG